MKRRDFLGTNVLALAGGALAAGAADAAGSQPGENATIQSQLSPNVQMQFMRPAQLEAAGRKFPVVSVPFGLIGQSLDGRPGFGSRGPRVRET